MSVINTRFFPFLDQFGTVFPVFGLKIIPKWYNFGQKSLFTLLSAEKPDFSGPYGPGNWKTLFSAIIIAFGTTFIYITF